MIKWFFFLLILESCTNNPIPEGKEADVALASQKKWGYRIDPTTDYGKTFNGDMILPEIMFEEDFEDLLDDVKNDRFKDYDQVMFDVYIDSLPDDHDWALVRLCPNMSYKLHNLSLDQINELSTYSFPLAEKEQLIGEWLMETDVITFYKKGNVVMFHDSELNGEIIDEFELVEENGKYFDPEDPEFYFKIMDNGNLQVFEYDTTPSGEIPSLENYISATQTLLSKSKKRLRRK